MRALIYLILFTITACHCAAEECSKSFYKNSEEAVNAMNTQQRSELPSNLSHRYINFINNIGSGNDSRGVGASSLFSENCRKNFNGRWVANDRNGFVSDLVSLYQDYGSWKLIPIDIITAYESGRIILRINIESKSFGNNSAMVILRYNSDYLIEEILEVFSPIQNGYDFNDPKAELTNSLAYGVSLKSLDKDKIEQVVVNKTLVSIGTDNLNGKTIDNTFSMYLDDKGNIFGKMGHKPADEPQNDKGVCFFNDDGSFSITWEHWDGAKQIRGYFFETENAYISIDDQNVFHTVFMKESIKNGNHLN